MNYYVDVLKKYAVFNGRASRKEYWMFVLYNIIISFVLGVVASIISGGSKEAVNAVSNLYATVIFVPTLAVGFRRMQDVNKNGWFVVIPIYNLILACTAGTKGDNKYGPAPVVA